MTINFSWTSPFLDFKTKIKYTTELNFVTGRAGRVFIGYKIPHAKEHFSTCSMMKPFNYIVNILSNCRRICSNP